MTQKDEVAGSVDEAAVVEAGAENDQPVAHNSADDQPGESEPNTTAGLLDDVADDAEIENLEAEFDNVKAELLASQDRLLRLQAEMENTRKRLTQEADNARKFGQKSLIEELLPICDSMEMGLQAANQEDVDIGKIREGYDLTAKMLKQMLGKFNVEAIDPVGEKFDPQLHQAMSMQEGTGKEPNTVVFVMQKGYTLNDRLIRPALVMVAK